MRFELSITDPNVTLSYEIESYPLFIIGHGDIFLDFPDGHSHYEKDFIWYSTASMKNDIRELLVIFKGQDVDIVCKMKKPCFTEENEMGRDIQEDLCRLLSNGS